MNRSVPPRTSVIGSAIGKERKRKRIYNWNGFDTEMTHERVQLSIRIDRISSIIDIRRESEKENLQKTWAKTPMIDENGGRFAWLIHTNSAKVKLNEIFPFNWRSNYRKSFEKFINYCEIKQNAINSLNLYAFLVRFCSNDRENQQYLFTSGSAQPIEWFRVELGIRSHFKLLGFFRLLKDVSRVAQVIFKNGFGLKGNFYNKTTGLCSSLAGRIRGGCFGWRNDVIHLQTLPNQSGRFNDCFFEIITPTFWSFWPDSEEVNRTPFGRKYCWEFSSSTAIHVLSKFEKSLSIWPPLG